MGSYGEECLSSQGTSNSSAPALPNASQSPAPHGEGDDRADKRPYRERQKRQGKTFCPASDDTDEIRSEKSAEIANRVDQRDAGRGAGAAKEFGRHRPEWSQRSPDSNRRERKRRQLGSGHFQERGRH